MNKITMMMSVSLDGYFEGPEAALDWHLVDEEVHQEFNDVLRPMAMYLEGRVVYELMEEFWPTADQDPDSGPEMVEYAGIYRGMPKVVYSRTMAEASLGPNSTLVRDVVPAEVEALKAGASGDLSVGGADLAATFFRLGLIDEVRLYVHPVVLGAGRRLFPDDLRLDLTLVESRRFGNGVVLLRYECR